MTQKFDSLFSKELRTTTMRAAKIAIRYRHGQTDLAHILQTIIEDPSQGIRNLSTETVIFVDGHIGRLLGVTP